MKRVKGDIMKKIVMIFCVCIMMVVGLIALNTGCSRDSDKGEGTESEARETAEKPFKIGLVTPLTGTDSYTGNLTKNALELAIAEKKTIQGRPIKLVTGDGHNNDAAIAEVERLMSVENVKFFLGGYGFSAIPIQATVMKNNGFLFETITWERDLLEGKYPNYFFNAPQDKDFGEVTATTVLSIGEQYLGKSPEELKVGMIGVSGFPANMPTIVRENLVQRGCKPVVYEIYDANLTDFTPIIMKLKSAGCDIVIPSQFPPDASNFRKTCVTLNYDPPVIFATGVAYDGIDFAQLGDAAEGCMTLCYANPDSNESNAEGLHEFKINYREMFGETALTHPLWMYAGAKIYLDAIDKAGSEDYDAVRAALYSFDIPPEKTVNHCGAKYDREYNFNIKSKNSMMVAQWLKDENGEIKFYTVYPPEMAIRDAVIPFER